MKYYSVVLPSMWRSKEKTITMLAEYEKSSFVKEVLFIDNDKSKCPDLSKLKKLIYLPQKENIYVNPAWNLGASLAKYEVILANDDIIIRDLDSVLSLCSASDYDIIGIDIKHRIGRLKIDEITSFPGNSYGCFMIIHNYIYIPEQFKIWYGDNFLFDNNKKRGVLRNLKVTADKNTTIDSVPEFRNIICRNCTELYDKLIKTESTDLNIIIRTSGRPNYFKKCIESIRKHAPEAKLHITIDDEKDLKYMQEYAYDFEYNYYLVNKDTIKNFCDKIQIERKQFIYNYYFNVVKPFLKGWCLFLDDDDVLCYVPNLPSDTKTIQLYKVDVGIKIVPTDENWMKRPVLNDVSGLSIIFHSTEMINWKPQRGGDYGFITEMYDKSKVEWINKVLSKVQTAGNFGKRNDLEKERNKLAVCIPMWKRPEVTSYVFNYYKNLKNELKEDMEIILLACGSEGKVSKDLAEQYGFIYIEHNNAEFLEKHNVIYQKAREYKPDACLKIDSDSIVSKEFFYYYDKLINQKYDYSGILDIYFLVKDNLCYWEGYSNHRKGETHGVGKFFSSSLLDRLDWRPFGNSQDRFPDRVVHNILATMNIKRTTTTCKEINGYCIDIKSNENLTPFDMFTFTEVIKTKDYKELDNVLLNPRNITVAEKSIKKVIIIIPCWGKSNVLEIVTEQLDKVIESNKKRLNISVVYIFSAEDAELKELLNVYKNIKHNKELVFSSNTRLGEKINVGINKAMELGFDYIMNLGSDDLVHHTIFDYYMESINTDVAMFGINTVYFCNERYAMVCQNYNYPNMTGAGRMIHRRVIEKVHKRMKRLYEPERTRGLDTQSAKRICALGFKQKQIVVPEYPLIVDIKTKDNINSYTKVLNAHTCHKKIVSVKKEYLEQIYPQLKKITHE